MESPVEDVLSEEIQVNQESGTFLREAAKWATFISVFYFVLIGLLMLILTVAASTLISSISRIMPEVATSGSLIITVIIIVLMIFTVTTIMLYRFAANIKAGIERQDQVLFNQGLRSLKLYFMVYGILAIVSLAFNAFSILAGLF